MCREWRSIKRLLARWLRAEDGPTAAEYAVLLGLIILVSVGVITTLGQGIAGLYAWIRAGLPEGIG